MPRRIVYGDRNRRLSEFRFQTEIIACTRCMEFFNLICGFQGSDMSSSHDSLTRERVYVSISVQNGMFGLESSVVGIPVTCDKNMLITCTSCVEFSYLICGFQGSDMSSNYTSLTREHVRVSMPRRTVYGDWNRRL